MIEPTTLGSWLRRERERRGVSLATISEDTKVGVGLLQALEADDLSRWPGGIFRRSFVRSYATAIGLDPDLVLKRIEEEHPSEPVDATPVAAPAPAAEERAAAPRPVRTATADKKLRMQAALLELLVAGAIGFGCAAAGSRLLWPVLAIAAYHALGVLLTGTSPMMALLMQPADEPSVRSADRKSVQPAPAARRPESEPRSRRAARARRAHARPDQNASR